MIIFEQAEIKDTDKVLYFLNIDGQRVNLSPEQFISFVVDNYIADDSLDGEMPPCQLTIRPDMTKIYEVPMVEAASSYLDSIK